MFQSCGSVGKTYSDMSVFYRYLLEIPPGPSVLQPLLLQGLQAHGAAAPFPLTSPSLPAPWAAWTPLLPGTALPSTPGDRRASPARASKARWVSSGKEFLCRKNMLTFLYFFPSGNRWQTTWFFTNPLLQWNRCWIKMQLNFSPLFTQKISCYNSSVKTSILFEKLVFSFKEAQAYFYKQFQIIFGVIFFMPKEGS